jgi:NitT/TauT family transport system permease protein
MQHPHAASALRPNRGSGVDWFVALTLAGLICGAYSLAAQWTASQRAAVEIDLSPLALPRYTFFSLARGLIAYGLSLAFTLFYGYWAAKDALAARVLIPLLDILQSLPVLAFLPGALLALSAAFPHSNIGLELCAILMIFTGQVWNMTFSFYHSVCSVPAEQQEAAAVYRFSWWQRLKWVELPFATLGLVWNSMLSMAGGWFFLTISEAYRLGEQDFRLPGLGSYLQVAIQEGRTDAMLWALAAMLLMIVGLDQLVWRPAVVWAQKFRVEEGAGEQFMSSWLLDWLRQSRLLAAAGRWLQSAAEVLHRRSETRKRPAAAANWRLARPLTLALFGLLLAGGAIGAWQLLLLLAGVSFEAWQRTVAAAAVTLARVLAATAIGTLWTVPAGLAIGLSPRLARLVQPVVQVVASFPAPMLFPLVLALLHFAGIGLGWGAVWLMLLGTQWYILFNVIAGAMGLPADLREMARSYRLTLWQRLGTL